MNGWNRDLPGHGLVTRREFLERSALMAGALAGGSASVAAAGLPSEARYPVGELEPVAVIRPRPEWRSFIILVWQWQTDVRRDAALYDLAGLHGFHIDYGAGEDEYVRLSLARGFPYYVDHAAGKGILYLHKDVQAAISGKASLQARPHSLADPQVVENLKRQLRDNVNTTKRGLVYAYAFDDEISTGAFNNPVEVDAHPLSVAWYRSWLARRYVRIDGLNAAWTTSFASFDDVVPEGFETARRSAAAAPFSSWNLAPWMEWRHFMDYQFAQVLAELTRYTNTLDARIPAGFVGGQQPSAYGGYDYALLSRAVQWMEASDTGGIPEVLRSLWNRPRRAQAQTYQAGASPKKDVWTLWCWLAHGIQAAIAWPEGWIRDTPAHARELSPGIAPLAPAFREIQGAASAFIVSPDAYLEADPIGIYYSHPSIRASWAIDCIPHGATWPKRVTSIDDANLSSAHLRHAWCKLLEDLGYQYDFVTYLDVVEGRVDLLRRFKVIILPQTICLSDREAQTLTRFVRSGGMLVADALCGLLTESGRGRPAGNLDDVFGIRRDESLGYFNGRGITEINGELHNRAFAERLTAYDGALQYRSMIVCERGTRAVAGAEGVATGTAEVAVRRSIERGRTLYLNLTPMAYGHFPIRSGNAGAAWREMVGAALRDAGLHPRVEVYRGEDREPWMESLLWRKADRYCLAVLKNPSDVGKPMGMIDQMPFDITMKLRLPARGVRNVRTGKVFGDVSAFTDSFTPWEANLYEFGVGA